MAQGRKQAGSEPGRGAKHPSEPWPRNKLVRVNPLPSKPMANARPDTDVNYATLDERGAPSPVAVGDEANPPAGQGID